MSKKISASDAKNNFGGLIEEVAVVLSARVKVVVACFMLPTVVYCRSQRSC
jgi:hypothetical protein